MQTVFVVDDDPEQVELAQVCLTRAGFCVKGFCNPFAALAAAIDNPPDLMIVDHWMPRMEGLQLIKEVRKAGVDCKFMVMSGVSGVEELTTLKKNGVCRYLNKPQALNQLTQEVRSVLQ
jgi:two-component system nitrogen regulation response regulator NtrX